MPPWRRSQRPAPARAGQQRGLGQRLGLERGGRERGGADHAGPGRRAGRGVEDVVARRAVLGAPQAAVDARRGDRAAGRCCKPMDGLAGERMADVDVERLAVALTRRSPPQSIAQRSLRGEAEREQVGGEALAGAAGVEPKPGRAARCVPSAEAAACRQAREPGRGSRPGGGGAAASASASASSGSRRVAVVAGGLERAGRAWGRRARRSVRRPISAAGDGGAQQRRGGHLGARSPRSAGRARCRAGTGSAPPRSARERRDRTRAVASSAHEQPGVGCPCSRRCDRS